MPQPQIHRHEKPPIPWTSISMSKKREAVHIDEVGAQSYARKPLVVPQEFLAEHVVEGGLREDFDPGAFES